MARSAFCTTCSRTVYVEIEDSLVCPVCSSPILEAIGADDETELEPNRGARLGGPQDREAQSSERK